MVYSHALVVKKTTVILLRSTLAFNECSTNLVHVICIGLLINFLHSADDLRLQIVTIATEETDGYHRFMRSARLFDLNVEVMFIINTT